MRSKKVIDNARVRRENALQNERLLEELAEWLCDLCPIESNIESSWSPEWRNDNTFSFINYFMPVDTEESADTDEPADSDDSFEFAILINFNNLTTRLCLTSPFWREKDPRFRRASKKHLNEYMDRVDEMLRDIFVFD